MTFCPNVMINQQNAMCCTVCGSSYLHHSTVEVFDRAEDADDVRRSHIARGEPVVIEQIANKGSANPSLRRDGVRIKLWCEGCEGEFWLDLSQHKGESILEWSKA